MAQQGLQASGCAELAASGVVLTGGGAQMEGMCEIAEDIFQMPVRKGIPAAPGLTGPSARSPVRLTDGGFAGMISEPRFATGVGLLLYGATHEPMDDQTVIALAEDRPGIGRRLGSWVRELF